MSAPGSSPSPRPCWLLLRGLARECRHWGEVPARLAARLDAEVRCLDLPGNGRYHRQQSAVSVSCMLEQIRQRARPHPRVHLLGLSMGGMIAAQWAMRYPREVAGLVLINSSSALSPPWQRLRPTALPALLRALLLPPAQREALVYRLTCARREERHATLQDWTRYAGDCPVWRSNLLRQLAAAARYRLPAGALPVAPLILCSRHDRLVDYRCSLALARHWHTRAHVHYWAGHDLPHDDPDWLLSELADYVNKQEKSAFRR
ncbi:alpha/beta fold hydrolase [Oceanimonas pelagia]|uniref:Alpha/beta fold hydrolase n=1 Tax=Oceanimonas pelagia TaxID=3028314 RepID=A0AA50QAQ0_9GAMM|nr:alpha/beta fold hydrolase [Oceanimonas pelagia]WMC11273.1 alpha/beta fold hydrolase [Oceanimonas pelagia]